MTTWLVHGLRAAGLDVACLDARRVKAALQMQLNKTDENDAEGLAQIMRDHTGGYARSTVHQNIVLRWVRDESVYEVWQRLVDVGLAAAGARDLGWRHRFVARAERTRFGWGPRRVGRRAAGASTRCHLPSRRKARGRREGDRGRPCEASVPSGQGGRRARALLSEGARPSGASAPRLRCDTRAARRDRATRTSGGWRVRAYR